MKDGEEIGGQACLHQDRAGTQFRQRDEENACCCVSLSIRKRYFLSWLRIFFSSFIHFITFLPTAPFFKSLIPEVNTRFAPHDLTTSHLHTNKSTHHHHHQGNTLTQWETIQKHSPSASESLVSDTHSCSPRSQQRSSFTR